MGTQNSLTVVTDLLVAEARPKLKRPTLYKVVLLNDDYTPMVFVVEVLERFFGMTEGLAVQLMWRVHRNGKAVCGIYSFDIAETKVSQVNGYSQANEYPLLCGMEAA